MAGRAHIPDHFTMREFERDYWQRVLAGLNADDQRFVLHVRQSSRQPRYWMDGQNGYVPVGSVTLRQFIPKARLINVAPFLDCKDYSIEQHRSREFRLKQSLIDAEAEARAKVTTSDYLASPKVDYFSGHVVKRHKRSQLYTDSRNELPELIQDTVKAFTLHPVTVNDRLINEHLNRLKMEEEESLRLYGFNSVKHKKAHRQYRNDRNCYDAVLDQDYVLDGEFGHYYPRFRLASTGRLVQVGGGIQSASKAMKKAAFTGLPDIDTRNYDFKSAHLLIGLQLLEDAGIKAPHLREYTDDGGREHYAAMAGVEESLLKEVVLASLNGAAFPHTVKESPFSGSSIRDAVLDAYENDRERAKAAIEGLDTATAGLRSEFSKLRKLIWSEYVPKHTERRGRSGPTFTNAVGIKLPLSELNGLSGIRRATVHTLQGLESAHSHSTIVQHKRLGFIPLSHEYDGFISAGTVDVEAVAEIGRGVGIRYSRLVEKPLK